MTFLGTKSDFVVIKHYLRRVTILLIEQNANTAFHIADKAYVMETGRITMTRTGAELLANPDVKKAYLGDAAH